MRKNSDNFLSTLTDYIHNRITIISESFDTAAFASLAQRQECGGIVYYQTHIPELKSSYAFLSYYALNRKKLLEKIHSAFASAGIQYLIFKGTEIAQYYPQPELRSMGDMDILVKESDRIKAGQLLMTFGFSTNEEETVGSDWVFTKGEWEIELHNCMLYLNDKNSKCHVDYTDQAWNRAYTDDGVQYHLKPEFHFVFLILHLRKHFLWSGVGIRQFLDLAMMIKNCPMDWAVIERDLTELQLPDFAKVCFALIQRWFDVTVPVECAEISEAFYESSTETILGSGVFGDMDKDTIVDNAVMNTVRKENSGCWDKMKMMLEVVFPSFDYMKTKYPRMAVSPLLLPLLWLWRIVESILTKRAGGSFSYAAKPLSLNREMQERDELLKQWGL